MTAGGTRDSGGRPGEPDGEAAVRRLLAEAGGPVEMPADVAARLDAVLADLERERSGGDPAAAVPDAVELRARRRWPRLMLAAAAVVVGGYGIGTVVTQGTLSGADDATSADSAASESLPGDDEASGGRHRGPEDRGQGQVESKATAPGTNQDRTSDGSIQRGYSASLAEPVALRSDRLRADVRRALRVLDERVAVADLRSGDAEPLDPRGCPPPRLSRDERSLPVRYDGEPAALVTGPAPGGGAEVTVLDCSGTEIAATLVRR